MTLALHRILKGNISAVKVDNERASAEILGLEDLLQTTVRDTTTANCPYRFQSFSCGVVAAGVLGVVDSNTGTQTYAIGTVAAPAFTDAQYVQGTIRVLGGPAAGEEFDISSLTAVLGGVNLTLLSPVLRALPAGSPVIIYPGCTKTLESCASYNNLDRGRHLPRIRGSKVYTNAEGIEVVT